MCVQVFQWDSIVEVNTVPQRTTPVILPAWGITDSQSLHCEPGTQHSDLHEGMRMPGLVSTGPASQPANTRGNAGPRHDESASQPANIRGNAGPHQDECVCVCQCIEPSVAARNKGGTHSRGMMTNVCVQMFTEG